MLVVIYKDRSSFLLNFEFGIIIVRNIENGVSLSHCFQVIKELLLKSSNFDILDCLIDMNDDSDDSDSSFLNCLHDFRLESQK
jgi:hypothetical protein